MFDQYLSFWKLLYTSNPSRKQRQVGLESEAVMAETLNEKPQLNICQ